MIFIKGYILAALASVPVYGMAIADHNAFHNILTEMQDEVWKEHEATSNQQAISIMDLILQDLDKIDQFHHNYEMMTHGETSSHDKRSPENAMMMDFFKKRGNSAMNDYLARFRLP